MSEGLIVTVGSNPLPVVVAILAIKPSHIHYVHTPQVGKTVDRIEEFLKKQTLCPEARTASYQLVQVVDHRVVRVVREALDDAEKDAQTRSQPLPSVAAIHYSGGTKTMVVHAHGWWRERQNLRPGDLPARATYLGGDGWLRSDDGNLDVDLRTEPKLTLEQLLGLHFAGEIKSAEDSESDVSRATDRLNQILAGAEPTDLDGKVLEIWLARKMRDLGVFDSVNRSVKVFPPGSRDQDFEVDVVAIKGHRAFVFSCVLLAEAGARAATARRKLAESVYRAEHLGGELARAAVVSLHRSPAAVLRSVGERHWEGDDQLRVFGRLHVEDEADVCQPSSSRRVTLDQGIRDWVGV